MLRQSHFHTTAMIAGSVCWGKDGKKGDKAQHCEKHGGDGDFHFQFHFKEGKATGLEFSVAGNTPFGLDFHLPKHFEEVEGKWVHITLTHNVKKKHAHLYVDGELVDTRAFQKAGNVRMSLAHIGDW